MAKLPESFTEKDKKVYPSGWIFNGWLKKSIFGTLYLTKSSVDFVRPMDEKLFMQGSYLQVFNTEYGLVVNYYGKPFKVPGMGPYFTWNCHKLYEFNYLPGEPIRTEAFPQKSKEELFWENYD